jgi:hypothetical protein
MQTRTGSACLIALVIATGLTGAENPFAGTWELNLAKSNFTGDTMKFERTSSGEIRWSGSGLSYTFKIDGKEYPGPFGDDSVAWREVDDHTWETTYKTIGVLDSIDTSKLSPDGKTMTMTSRGAKHDEAYPILYYQRSPLWIHTGLHRIQVARTSFENISVYQRRSGEGLFGTWENKEVRISSPELMQLTPSGDDGIAWEFVHFEEGCKCKFDGKDYPWTGLNLPARFTMALKRTGSSLPSGTYSFEYTVKRSGRPLFKGKYTLSEDGRTLTGVAGPIAVDEPITAVFERQ